MRPDALLKRHAPSPSLLRHLRAHTSPRKVPSIAATAPQCARCLSSSAGPNSSTSSRALPEDNRCGVKPTIRARHSPRCSSVWTGALGPGSHYTRLSNVHSGIDHRRCFSATTAAAAWWKKWKPEKRTHAHTLQPGDLPVGASGEENAPLGRFLKPGKELKLRCTVFDANGTVRMVNENKKKTELISEYGLPPRDLRKIDSSILPNILVRPSAVLLNLLHHRVLIKHNQVLVFDAYGSTDSYAQSQFMYELETKLKTHSADQPYEFRALEAVLVSVMDALEFEFETVREPVVRVLRELEEDIDRDKLRYLLIYSKKLGTFEQKARLVRNALDELLEADDDLAAMYLSDAATGHARSEDDHTEIEMLIESYHKVADEIVQAAENLVSNIRNTEEIVRAILDANRNSLMLLELKFSIGTLGLGAGTFFAALYGMNLKNFIEESDIGFWGVSGGCFVFSCVVCWYGLTKLRRVQRISMWGHSGNHQAARGRRGLGQLNSPVTAGNQHLSALGDGAGTAGLGHLAPMNRRAERMKKIKEAYPREGMRGRNRPAVIAERMAELEEKNPEQAMKANSSQKPTDTNLESDSPDDVSGQSWKPTPQV